MTTHAFANFEVYYAYMDYRRHFDQSEGLEPATPTFFAEHFICSEDQITMMFNLKLIKEKKIPKFEKPLTYLMNKCVLTFACDIFTESLQKRNN